MAEYHVEERDMMFNLKECPGISLLSEVEAFADCDEDTLDMIFDQSKAFCTKVLAPICQESDKADCQLKDGKVILPDSIGEAWEQYKELGLIGMNSSSEYGGSDLPHLFSVPVCEMECGSFVAFSMLPLLTRGSARLIQAFASDTLKELYLERMFTGEWTGTMCLTEPGAGSDVGAGVTKAEPEGDHFKISGTKIFISWGDHEFADNIIHLVLARIPGSPAGSKGLSLFVVPKYRVDADGKILGPNDVQTGNIEHKMGIKASPTCVINFGTDDACHGYLIGEAGMGMKYMFQMMNEARIEVGCQGVGIASAAYGQALSYAKDRVQGVVMTPEGPRQAKIIEHEDVRRMLLKMRALTQGSRSLLYHLMLYVDMAHNHPTKAERYNALVELLTPICKSYGSDQGFRVTEMGVQIHGGYGYCKEYPAEQYLRDCKISSLYEGTNGIQALDLVFRKILMNQGANIQVWAEDVKELCASVEGTDLADLAQATLKGLGLIVETATHFGKLAATNRHDEVRFHATEFMDNMGHVMIGYFLLKQAAVSAKALTGDVSDVDREFYEQKLVTARYFYETLIPPAHRALKVMSADVAPAGLKAVFN